MRSRVSKRPTAVVEPRWEQELLFEDRPPPRPIDSRADTASTDGPPEQHAEGKPLAVDQDDELGDCLWSPSVALDPRHRPQVWDEPSGTVRREWCRYPQEAHLLDEYSWRYRRLTVDEIAIIQGFEPSWVDVPGLTRRTRIKAIGDAVPPPLARAVLEAVDSSYRWEKRTAIEICAGAGGLASGAHAVRLEHLLLVDQWGPACAILRHGKPWGPDRVAHTSVKEFDFAPFRGCVGLLSGGPPCQPWSQGGKGLGVDDPRDLLAWIHVVVGVLAPEVFVFENVPGLGNEQNAKYLRVVLERLRRPRGEAGPRYGVVAGLLNAADYGVPQLRRRIFILGFRDAPAALAYRVFDRIRASATHRDPAVPHAVRRRWVTLRGALGARPDPGGWRRWVNLPNEPPQGNAHR